jgi:ubiquitin-protein ligase
MLTDVFHPNIARNGLVCIGDEGDHGYAPSMGLDDLVVRIVEIIRYENMGLNSAFNTVAARWANKHQGLFPLESSQIVSEELIEISILDEIQIVEQDTDGEDLDIVIY